MARRRKHRTHVQQPASAIESDGTPRSFIIKHGQVGPMLSQLVRDMRKVMEPNTASRLKERTRNKLKDYLTMAPALHVTHLLAFTLTPVAPSLRIVRLSAGPTLTFRIERYSLMKDVLNARKRARSMGLEYLSAPLLVLAAFPPPSPKTPPHLTLLMKTFQSMFPPLSPQTLSLSSARRVVLVSYNAERNTIDFRHYLITVKPYGVSSRVRHIVEGGVKKTGSTLSAKGKGFLDLGNEKDVADFLLRRKGQAGPGSDGYETATSSASSVVGDDADAFDLADDYVGRNNRKGQRRAVRLDEIGPRLELRLVKIVEGLPGREGSVIHHEFVKKSKAETKKQKVDHAEKERLRKERREEQEKNVQRKKEAAGGDRKVKFAEEDDDENEDEKEDDDEGAWDDEEEISEEEESAVEESSSEEEVQPPAKRSKTKKAKSTT